jgi:steroid 5-alpha reductase family enzyme
VLVTVWGLRLAIYLGRRNFGHDEDRRSRVEEVALYESEEI